MDSWGLLKAFQESQALTLLHLEWAATRGQGEGSQEPHWAGSQHIPARTHRQAADGQSCPAGEWQGLSAPEPTVSLFHLGLQAHSLFSHSRRGIVCGEEFESTLLHLPVCRKASIPRPFLNLHLNLNLTHPQTIKCQEQFWFNYLFILVSPPHILSIVPTARADYKNCILKWAHTHRCYVSICNITRDLHLATDFWRPWGIGAISVATSVLLGTGTNYRGWVRLTPVHLHQLACASTPQSTQGSRSSRARHGCPSHATVIHEQLPNVS